MVGDAGSQDGDTGTPGMAGEAPGLGDGHRREPAS